MEDRKIIVVAIAGAMTRWVKFGFMMIGLTGTGDFVIPSVTASLVSQQHVPVGT